MGHVVVVYTHAYETDQPAGRSGTDVPPATYVGVHQLPGGIKAYYVPRIPVYQSATLPTIFGSLYKLRQVLIEEQIDLVHAHQAFSAMANESIIHARTMNIPTVFTDHSLFGFADASSILMNKALKFSLADVQRVICVSHTSRENTVLRACIRPSQVYVIPNAVDMDSFYPVRKSAEELKESDRTVVVMSRLVYRKGIDLLVLILPILLNRYPDLRVVIGGDGPKRKELEDMLMRRDLGERVRMAGLVQKEDVRAFLGQGSIFLNCSLTEAFCVALVEAAAVGLTVVSTSVGGVPEVLPDDMMILAEEPSPEGIISAVERALDRVRSNSEKSVEERWAGVHRQYERVVGMYSWSVVASRTEKVYVDALNVKNSVLERLRRYNLCGKWFGKLCVLIACMDLILLKLMDFFDAIAKRSQI